MSNNPKKAERGPRRWLSDDQSWTDHQPAWQTGATVREQAQAEAAHRQHRIAVAVRVEQARTGIQTAAIAKTVGLSVHQLRRMLRGEAHMPTDVAEAVLRTFGYRTTFGIRRVGDEAVDG